MNLLQRIDNLFRVIDMLINLGVDASEVELDKWYVNSVLDTYV